MFIWSFLPQRTAFGSYKTLAYLPFVVAAAWNWLIEGQEGAVDHAKAPVDALRSQRRSAGPPQGAPPTTLQGKGEGRRNASGSGQAVWEGQA